MTALPHDSKAPKLELAFDVGHSSIGWAVFQADPFAPLGAGSVIFPADDCLAKKRRDYRRQRRHIRSTRQRIERMKRLLEASGFLTRAELDKPGGAWPWKWAAQAQTSDTLLSPRQLWDVLRWYAHNRGYDGNSAWTREDDPSAEEDHKKVETAMALMKEWGTHTMAETFCKILKVDPQSAKSSSSIYIKGLGAAFPRNMVRDELRQLILDKHTQLPGLNETVIRCLMDTPDEEGAALLKKANIRLPKRYQGGVLFGQLIPRFDNRIISSCPVTYEKVYTEEIRSGKNADDARRAAERAAKVPGKKSREFLLYRWAMLLANIRIQEAAGARPLSAEERQALHRQMIQAGKMTKREFGKAVEGCTNSSRHNVSACLMAPEADKSLILRPESGKAPAGRAPYTRSVMQQAAHEVLQGRDPRESGGVLYLGDALRSSQLARDLNRKTNNHLVRHRILILRRVLKDIINNYANGDAARVSRITMEVNRDLQTFSGLTAKEKEQDQGLRLSDFNQVVKRLRERLGPTVDLKPGLIRKARIAQDLGWTCPYTGHPLDEKDLTDRKKVDKDHIIPRSHRPSDSLDSLVITFKEVNDFKGQRTAVEFIKECGGKPVPGRPELTILPWSKYEEAVKKLESFKGHAQDKARKRRRKELLLLEHYVEKEFVPKDLTQTSHLVRLAAEELKKEFLHLADKPVITSMPGSVTGEVRKSWKMEGCLSQANPQVAALIKKRKESMVDISLKQEIRGVTHLHHALDACVLACAAKFLGRDGAVWRALVQRHKTEAENALLMATGLFKLDGRQQARLQELPEHLRQVISLKLSECRVVQHMPSSMNGMRAEETVWRVLDPTDSHPSAVRIRRWAEESGVTLPSADSAQVLLVRRIRKGGAGAKAPTNLLHEGATYWWAWDLVSRHKLIGPGQPGKLNRLKGAKQISENFGIQLAPEAEVIPFQQVHARLRKNGNHPTLRKGHLIRVPQGRYQGVWKVFSTKDTTNMGLVLDLGFADRVRLSNKGERQKINVSLKTLLRDGMEVLKVPLTGVPVGVA